MPAPLRICFVCLGNICRSPTAQGAFGQLVARAGLEAAFEIDSAGTAAYHVGEAPDARSVAAAATRGVQVTGQARRFEATDFASRDRVVAMDADNAAALHALAGDNAAYRTKIVMLRDFDPDSAPGSDVPDPYYGGPGGFDDVVSICLAGAEGLLQSLRDEYGL